MICNSPTDNAPKMLLPRSLPLKRLSSLCLLVFAFALPLATSASTLAAGLVALAWLWEGNFSVKLKEIGENPVCRALGLYMAVLLIGLLWSDDLSQGMQVIATHWKIMLLPLFLTVLRGKERWPYLAAFLAGLSLVMLSSYLSWLGVLAPGREGLGYLIRQQARIFYNPMLALAAYLLAQQAIWGELPRRWRFLAAGLAVSMSINMFMTDGRAGQLAFLLLATVLTLQYFRAHLGKAILALIVLLPLFLLLLAQISPVFYQRWTRAWHEVQQFEAQPYSEVGLRLLYWSNSWRIIQAAPLAGEGTGDFKAAYAKINAARSPTMPYTDNPHSQYVFIATQLGIVGLAALFFLFGVQLWQARREQDAWSAARLAFPLFFLSIMLTETYLIVHETALLFAFFSALLYKKPNENTSQPTPTAHRAIAQIDHPPPDAPSLSQQSKLPS